MEAPECRSGLKPQTSNLSHPEPQASILSPQASISFSDSLSPSHRVHEPVQFSINSFCQFSNLSALLFAEETLSIIDFNQGDCLV